MQKKAFAGIELLIGAAVIVGIIIALMAATNILDQIAKTSDNNTLEISRQINSGIVRSYGSTSSFPWQDELSGIAFSSKEGMDIINKIVSVGELKKNFIKISGKKLEKIFLTTIGNSHFTICFFPESKFYSTDIATKYNKFGQQIDCKKEKCYVCLSDGLGTEN